MTAMRTVAPTSRVDAVRHLWIAASFAADALADAATRDDVVRQIRCDLHALGVTSDELDAAGLR